MQRLDEKELFNDVIFTDERAHIPTGESPQEVLQKEEDPEKAQIQAQTSAKDPCVGWHFQVRSHTPCDVQRDHDCNEVWRHPVGLSCPICEEDVSTRPQIVSGIMILNIPAGISEASLQRITSPGGRVLLRVPI